MTAVRGLRLHRHALVLALASASIAAWPAGPAFAQAAGAVRDYALAPGPLADVLNGTASSGGAGTAGTVFQVDIGYVAPVAAAIAAFTASPTAVTLGSDGKPSGSTTLAWQADHATACTASGAWSGAKQTSGSEALLPAIEGANAYTLTCSGAGGDATATVTVTATRAPATGGGTTPTAPAGGTPASDGGGGGPLGPLALLAAGAALLARRRPR